jgi:hypothetical protein
LLNPLLNYLLALIQLTLNIFDDAEKWIDGAYDSVGDFLNPCDKFGCRFGWDDVPDDWRERKDRSGKF